jgi:hypothetical protein
MTTSKNAEEEKDDNEHEGEQVREINEASPPKLFIMSSIKSSPSPHASSSLPVESKMTTTNHLETTDFLIENDNISSTISLTLPSTFGSTISGGESKLSSSKTSYDSLAHNYSEEPLKQLEMKKIARTKNNKASTRTKKSMNKIIMFSDDALLRSIKKPMIKASGLKASGLQIETKLLRKKVKKKETNSAHKHANRKNIIQYDDTKTSTFFNKDKYSNAGYTFTTTRTKADAIKHANALKIKQTKKRRHSKMKPNKSVEGKSISFLIFQLTRLF